MLISARESLVKTCPELYRALELNHPEPPKLQKIGNQVVKQLYISNDTSSEAWINSILLEHAVDRTTIVIMNRFKDEKMYIPYVEGRIISRKYRPLETRSSKDDEDLAAKLYDLCTRLTFVLGDDIAFNHGDLGLNNILDQNGSLKVIDFEHAYLTKPNDKFNNISQLITRVWFDLPLALALTKVASNSTDNTGQFQETLQKHIDRKRLRGITDYSKFTPDSTPLTNSLFRSLNTIENSARSQSYVSMTHKETLSGFF